MKISQISLFAVAIALLSVAHDVASFSFNKPNLDSKSSSHAETGRRALLLGGAALLAGSAPAVAKPMNLGDPNSVVGREIQSFQGLIYNFKNTALSGGLDASKLNEPSIPFIEFGEKMKNGEVTFVEFMAPNGEVAYATINKENGGKPIRIGEGYPTGGKNSWSSPDYVIRSVSNFGVPYVFTVPALKKYRS